jgi:integrase
VSTADRRRWRRWPFPSRAAPWPPRPTSSRPPHAFTNAIARDRIRRVVFQPDGQREVEQDLGVGLPLDLGEQRLADVSTLIGTDPRVIADDVWAKLLHAGLNIDAANLPGTSAGSYYPMELIQALTLTWLFSGLRIDEIFRLRVGCIRWQHDGLPIPGDSREIHAADALCLLDIPVNKTGTKPVDPLIGQAIQAWLAQRPAQPRRLDRKTSEHADMLFSVRAHPVGKTYINRTIIPALCAKARGPDR